MTMRKISISTLMITIALTLAGCSTFKSLFPPSPQKMAQQKQERLLAKRKKIQSDCDNAKVLLSNLTKPINQRTYSVKPGEVCHG